MFQRSAISTLCIVCLLVTLCGCTNTTTSNATAPPNTADASTPPSDTPTTTQAEQIQDTPFQETPPAEFATLEDLQDFLTPYVAWRDTVAVSAQPDEEDKWLSLHYIVYHFAQSVYFEESDGPEALRPGFREEDYRMLLSPAQFVQAAGDYMAWAITPQQVTEYYEKASQEEAFTYLTPDGQIALPVGDGDMRSLPCITTATPEADGYRVILACQLLDLPFQPARSAEALIRINPDSMFGFTLTSYDDEPLVALITASGTQEKYPASHAIDGEMTTAWVADTPTDCWLVLQFANPVQITGVTIFPGYAKDPDLLMKNNRIRKLQVTLENGDTHIWDVPDKQDDDEWSEPVTLTLPVPVVSGTLQLTVLDVYPGSQYNDTCISEVEVIPVY